MRPAENVKRLIKNLQDKTSAEMDERLLEDVLRALEESEQTSALMQPNIRSIIMKTRMTRLAVAAVIVIGVLAVINAFWGATNSVVLANVVERIEQVKAYSCEMSATFKSQDVDEMPISQATVLISQTFGTRTDIEIHNPITGQSMIQEIYVLPPKRTITTLMPDEKKYSQIECDEASFEGWQKEYDPGFMVRRILECEHVSLGRSTIDDIEVEGFQTTDPDYLGNELGQVYVKIWVDTETHLPVRIEMNKAEEDKGHMHIVVYHFQWDVPADAAAFEPVIPDDYTPGQPMLQILPGNRPAADEESAKEQKAKEEKWSMKAKMGMKMLAMSEKAVIDEEAAIKGLKLFAELGSDYPETLDMPTLVNELARLVKGDRPSTKVFRETIREMNDEEVMNYKLEAALSVQGLGRFYQTLVQDNKEPAYYGKSVTPNDADQLLMRWKVSENHYRVIRGGLHAETVTADALADLENQRPQ